MSAPLATQRLSRKAPIRFAHPAEAEIARLLDFHSVAWQYEPTTFALVTGEHGQPIQSFTPDFYLPDHDLYIEMTTMRQSLVTRKNRKFRLLRELYPELNVRLLYRKDVELILDRSSGRMAETSLEIVPQAVIREDQIRHRASEMAEALLDGTNRPYCLLALGKGAIRTRDLVASSLRSSDRPVQGGLLLMDSYGSDRQSCAVRLGDIGDLDMREMEVVVVADIIGTGLTALGAIEWLRSRGAKRVRLISLLDRRSSRLIDLPLECAGVPVTANWLVGAGLGESARFRDLPDIHMLSTTSAV